MKIVIKVFSAVMALMMAVTSISITSFAASPSMKIHAINIYGTATQTTTGDDEEGNEIEQEYGDAVLLESNGSYLLIDTGAEYAKDSVVKYLTHFFIAKGIPASDRHLSVYISHVHSDHIGGLKALSENFTIDKLYMPDFRSKSEGGGEIGKDYLNGANLNIETITRSVIINRAGLGIPGSTTDYYEDKVVFLKKGSTFSVGNVQAEVLGPVGTFTPSQFDGDSKKQQSHYLNNCSLTTMFTCGSVKFLTTGDIEREEESALLNAYSASKMKADVLKMPHHGLTTTSNTEKFFKVVAPKYFFACNMGYETTETEEGKVVPKNYTAIDRAQKYGLSYMVGTEEKSLIVDVASNKINLYRDSDNDSVADSSEKLSGWVTVKGIAAKSKTDFTGDNKYYIDSNGNILTGVQKIGGKYYYLGVGGAMESGNYESGSYSGYRSYGKELRYFSTPDSLGLTSMAVGFVDIKDDDGVTHTFYYKNDGFRYKGSADWDIITIDGEKYAVNDNGVVRTDGWLPFTVDGKLNYRYFDASGVMQTGWQTVDGKKYYLDKTTGLRYLGLKKVGDATYYFVETNSAGYIWTEGWKGFGSNYRYFGKDGKMATGWLTVEGKKYYMDPSTGLRTLGLKEVDGNTYYFVETNNAGYAYSEGWKKAGKNYRFFNTDGTMAKGWLTDAGKKYYMDKSTGLRTLGFKKIGSNVYYFVETNSAGYVYKSGWKTFKVDKKTVYSYSDKKGYVAVGFKTISGATYYFNPETYYRTTGFKEIDGAYYFFNEYGKMQKSKTVTIDKVKCKFDKNGKLTSPTVKKPKSLKVKAKSKGKNVVSWKKNSKATGYIVYRATKKNGTYKAVKTIKKNSTVSFTDSKAKSKTKYFYKVEAYKTISGVKVKSPMTSPVNVKTK